MVGTTHLQDHLFIKQVLTVNQGKTYKLSIVLDLVIAISFIASSDSSEAHSTNHDETASPSSDRRVLVRDTADHEPPPTKPTILYDDNSHARGSHVVECGGL